MHPDKRHRLLEETSLTTAVSSMRSTWGLVSSYWRSPDKGKAYMMAGAIAGLTVAEAYLNIKFLGWLKDMFDAGLHKDMATVGLNLGLLGLSSVGRAAMLAARDYSGHRLHLSWRGWLTDRFNSGLTTGKAFFHLTKAPGTTENPDQHSENAHKLTGTLIGLGMGSMAAVAGIVSITNMMMQMADPATLTMLGHTVNAPGSTFWLGFAGALGCAAAGTWLIHKVGKPLAFLNQKQIKAEGHLRASFFNLFNDADEIAAYDGQKIEGGRLKKAFNSLQENWLNLMRTQAKFVFSKGVYDDSARPLSYGVGFLAYGLSKTMSAGGVVQFAEAFERLRGHFSWFINVYPALAEAKALIQYMTGLAKDIDDAQTPALIYARAGQKADIAVGHHHDNCVRIENLTVATPEGKTLLHIPALDIKQGERVLVSGGSGTG